MKPTEKALKQIFDIDSQIGQLDRKREALLTQQNEAKYPLRELIRKELIKISNERYKKEEKIKEIRELGLSTGEKTALIKEATNPGSRYVTIYRDKSLGLTSLTKLGWSKSLQSFVLLDLSVYTEFMRNVKGCASLAGKKNLITITLLTEEEADAHFREGCRLEVNFIGHKEEVIPINKTAASLRGNQKGEMNAKN